MFELLLLDFAFVLDCSVEVLCEFCCLELDLVCLVEFPLEIEAFVPRFPDDLVSSLSFPPEKLCEIIKSCNNVMLPLSD